MRTIVASGIAVVAAMLLAGGIIVSAGPEQSAKPSDTGTSQPSTSPLIAHEWGTFTSFSGSNGEPVGFQPNNDDLPPFIYYQDGDRESKSGRMRRAGIISMETPVIYFYTKEEMKASVKVDFPRGWITEWYPFASTSPTGTAQRTRLGGQTIGWNVNLTPQSNARLPRDREDNAYYHARETDAVSLEAKASFTPNRRDGGSKQPNSIERERFLFYRGVGTFPPPVTVQALGKEKIQIKNSSGDPVDGLVLLYVRNGNVRFQTIGSIEGKKGMDASLSQLSGSKAELIDAMVNQLTAAGLYEKEARAMVKTWDSAWFGEDGYRLLYLVPRKQTDELLPITIDPKPAELVRVLVGRHDFLTPEQEAMADTQVKRSRTARAEYDAAEEQIRKIGRFADQARQMAEKRIDGTSAQK